MTSMPNFHKYCIHEFLEYNTPLYWKVYNEMWDVIRFGTPEAIYFPNGHYGVINNVVEW